MANFREDLFKINLIVTDEVVEGKINLVGKHLQTCVAKFLTHLQIKVPKSEYFL